MKSADKTGISIGLVLGIPMTFYKNDGDSVVGHIAYVVGVTLFCWVVVRFVSRFHRPS